MHFETEYVTEGQGLTSQYKWANICRGYVPWLIVGKSNQLSFLMGWRTGQSEFRPTRAISCLGDWIVR